MNSTVLSARRHEWRQKPTWKRWVLGVFYSVVTLFALLFVSLVIAWSVAWPIPSLRRVSHITYIKFPPEAALVRGYDWNCFASELVGAQVRMPAAAVPAFLASPKVGHLTETRNGHVNPARYPELDGHGWDLTHILHFREAYFSDGSDTRLLVDLDDPHRATVYIAYDEP